MHTNRENIVRGPSLVPGRHPERARIQGRTWGERKKGEEEREEERGGEIEKKEERGKEGE